MTTQGNFMIAGWASVLSAVALIPVAAVAFAVTMFPHNTLLQGVNDVLSVLSAALGIYVLTAFKRLLHVHEFHAADLILALLISGLVVGIVLEQGVSRMVDPELAGGLLILVAIAFGVLGAVFGFKILPAAQFVAGPMTALAYLTIFSGVCVATVILFPLGMIASIASDVLLARVFFQASAPKTAEVV